MRTPLVRLGNLFPDAPVYGKCEFLAPSGCFKIRGAVHLLEHLRAEGKSGQPLVVPSMGNTALGAAVGARSYGFRMVGVVPTTISRAKDEKLQALDVELLKIQGGGNDLLRRAVDVARERNGYMVHPHLDPLWTDGYQAIAEEIFEELPGCRAIVFPVGGGGLLMGLAEYVDRNRLDVQLVGCEPYNYPKYGTFHHERSRTLADGLLLETPHAKVKERIESQGIAIHLVPEKSVQAALRAVYWKQGLLIEPSSAVPVAHLLAGSNWSGPVCVVLTGGNIAREDFDRILQEDVG